MCHWHAAVLMNGWAHLLHDQDAVVELLPLKEWVHVAEEYPQVLLAVPERDDDGHAMARDAVGAGSARPPPARGATAPSRRRWAPTCAL